MRFGKRLVVLVLLFGGGFSAIYQSQSDRMPASSALAPTPSVEPLSEDVMVETPARSARKHPSRSNRPASAKTAKSSSAIL